VTSSIIGIDTTTKQRVDIPQSSRRRGLYIIGATGTGKSTLIENLIVQDIRQGIGVCLLDPHGDLIDTVLSKLPDVEHEKKVVLLDILDENYPFGLNMFICSNPKSSVEVQKVVDQVMHIFERLFDITRSTPLMAQYLRNCTHTLIANPGYTMADIPLLLTNEKCRRRLVANITDRQVRLFWEQYENMKPSEQIERAGFILNKLDEFLQPLPGNIVGQSVSTIDLREIMDKEKILLVKLSARLDSVSSLIGSVLVALMLNAAYARADYTIPQKLDRQIR
jgi:hypothetical protein